MGLITYFMLISHLNANCKKTKLRWCLAVLGLPSTGSRLLNKNALIFTEVYLRQREHELFDVLLHPIPIDANVCHPCDTVKRQTLLVCVGMPFLILSLSSRAIHYATNLQTAPVYEKFPQANGASLRNKLLLKVVQRYFSKQTNFLVILFNVYISSRYSQKLAKNLYNSENS